jgi:hypothetical protein
VLQFRAAKLKLDIPLASVTKIAAADGTLAVTCPDGTLRLAIGGAAERWAERIRHPPSRLDKIGAKPDWHAVVIDVDDESFLSELKARVARATIGSAARADAIFVGAAAASDLAKLGTLKVALKPNGALWVIRPKGRPEISEATVMRAGKAAGLVDVKIVRFSATHTAEKFVIPVADRPR